MSGFRSISILFWIDLILIQVTFGQSFHDDKLNEYMSASEYRAAIDHTHIRMKELTEGEGLKKSYYLNQQGLAYFRLGNFDSAYIVGLQVLHDSRKSRDSILIADNWKLMAYVYNRKGRLDSAVYYSDKLLNYATRSNNQTMMGNALTSLATILMQNKRYREALKYNKEAYSHFLRSPDSTALTSAEYNIGLSYLNLNKPDSSLMYLFKGLRTNNRVHKKDIEPYIYEAISECYYQKGDIRLWKEYLQKSKVSAEQSGNPHFIAINLSQQGQQALIEGNLSKAFEYLEEAHKTLYRQPYPALQIRVDSMLYIVTKKQHRPADALQWLESYTSLKNQVLNSSQSEDLNKMVLKLETHEKTLKLKEKEIEMSKMKQKLIFTITGIIFLLLILSGILFYLFKIQEYQNRLFIKNKELDKQLQLSENIMELNLNIVPDAENELVQENMSQNSISVDKKLDLYRNLLQLVETHKLYLDPDLNSKSTQMKLGTNKKYLYEAIAEFSGTNFRGLINRFRINEVRLKFEESINKKVPISLNEVAFSSGFNSYASFYRVFKQQTGLTPNEYLAQLKKEIVLRKN